MVREGRQVEVSSLLTSPMRTMLTRMLNGPVEASRQHRVTEALGRRGLAQPSAAQDVPGGWEITDAGRKLVSSEGGYAMGRIIQTGGSYGDLVGLTEAQYKALVVVLAASEYAASPAGYDPFVRLSTKTRSEYPWNLCVNAVAAAALEKHRIIVIRVVEIGNERYEKRVDVMPMASAARVHTRELRTEVEALVEALREAYRKNKEKYGSRGNAP